MNLSNVISQLQNHVSLDETEAKHRALTLAFVHRHPDNFWRRTNHEGHLTASAFVVNKEHSHALMLHHAKLKKWLQPGGHIDDSDPNLAAAARRETREETGVTITDDIAALLFDVDVHPIPERIKQGVQVGAFEPAHLHYDLRYLFVAETAKVTISDESFGFRWVEIHRLVGGDVESGIARMATKILNR
ncbi:MAG: NUDIX hydrolase [Aeromicrobium sp.]|nr:NUDIX hydrolase [Burkholderiales bacterium]